MPRRPLVRRLVAALLALALLPACYSWRPTTANPVALITDDGPSNVRVTMNGGSKITFQNPRLTNDSIVGFTGTGIGRMSPLDVTGLEIRSFSPAKTTFLVVGHAAFVVGFIAAVIKVQPHYYGF